MSTEGKEAKVDYRVAYQPWPRDEDFPLTFMEAWYIMKGYAVRPAREIALNTFLELPGQLEMSDGYIMLRQT